MPLLLPTHKGTTLPIPADIKLPVLQLGSNVTLTPNTSPRAVYAIYAAKLTRKVGLYAAWRFAQKRGVKSSLFALAVMCEQKHVVILPSHKATPRVSYRSK